MKSYSARAAALAATIIMTATTVACAHGIRHTVTRAEAIIVDLAHSNGAPLAEATYEIYPPGETVSRISGRTGSEGRVSFVADTTGRWRVRVFTEDGHGDDITIDTEAPEASTTAGPGSRRSNISLAVGIILSVFGTAALFSRRKTT